MQPVTRDLGTSPDGNGARPRLLVLNQYYWPGVEATAHLLTELCESLADEYDVTVVTGTSGDGGSGRSERHGVEIVRVRSTAFHRRRLGPRAVNYATYVSLAAVAAMRSSRPDVVLALTDPPFVGAAAALAARRFNAPLVVVAEDVFPEIAVQVGQLRNPALVRLFDALVRLAMVRADRVVAIGETMRFRLEAKGVSPHRISVIPNWVDTESVKPHNGRNGWSTTHGLDERFVVMHSGNVGHAQDLDTLVAAAARLRDVEDLAVVVVGGGARHAELVALADGLGAEAVRFLPYQPREFLSQSLSAADLHVVGLARGLAGLVVPSRIYGILAAARPVIAAAEPEAETARLVRDVGCGVVVPPGEPDALADAIREAHREPARFAEMGRRGREYVTAHGDRSVAVQRYRALLREVRSAP